ncbi:MAG: hypothetical protein M3032_03730 [Verrucomicrobiota bacterium]|nr:hypothetical protein [Verrucomicrobiota bacterium]
MLRITTLLLVALMFTGCSSFRKKKPKDTAQTRKEDRVAQPSDDQDFNAFVGRLRKAVHAHDVQTVASMMTADFAYVMGSSPEQDRKGEGVFQYWDENGLWPELEGIVTESFVKKDDFMVAPPQFANPAIDYDGYRVGIRRVNGSWKFAYFVNG